jgi:allophanate hydrolase
MSPAPALLPLAVVAAHRTGQPLNPQLVALGGRHLRVTATAPVYRLLALAGGDVARGGIWWAGAKGDSIEVELHELPLAAVGALLSLLPAPLAIGRVDLADGSSVCGLLWRTGPTTRSTSPTTAAGRATWRPARDRGRGRHPAGMRQPVARRPIGRTRSAGPPTGV